MTQRTFDCDSCSQEKQGWTRKELEQDGWEFRTINLKRSFILCPECLARYTPLWEANKAAA